MVVIVISHLAMAINVETIWDVMAVFWCLYVVHLLRRIAYNTTNSWYDAQESTMWDSCRDWLSQVLPEVILRWLGLLHPQPQAPPQSPTPQPRTWDDWYNNTVDLGSWGQQEPSVRNTNLNGVEDTAGVTSDDVENDTGTPDDDSEKDVEE